MNKINRLTAYALALTVAFSACKEDDVAEIETGQTEIPEKFSSFTPEQNKLNLEDNGIELINQMEGLKTSKGLEATASFAHWMGLAPAAPANGRILKTARTLQKYQKGDASVKDVFSTMRLSNEEPAGIQEYYNQHIGVYSWNSATQEWDFVKEGSKIVFKFPSTETKTSNDAELLIHSYEGIVSPNPIDEDYTGDLPTKLISEVKVGGEQVMLYNFSAAYNQQGEPTSMITSLKINTFTFAFEAKNDTQNAGAAYSLTNGGKILISMGAGAKGLFTTAQVDKVNNSTNMNAGDIISEANAYFQVMNIKVAGNIDIAKYADGMDALDREMDGNDDYSQFAQKEAKLLNETSNLVVFYADKKEKIADTEFYSYSSTYEYITYDYNPNTGEWFEVTGTIESTSMGIKFIFADSTKTDMETYFGEGFDELTTELREFTSGL